jgi:Leucine-rich repeat (LRR) protein
MKLKSIFLTCALALGLTGAMPAIAQTYNANDVQALNAIINTHQAQLGAGWAVASPADGTVEPTTPSGAVTWTDDATNKRLTILNVASKSLTGTLDVTGLTALKELWCQNNQLGVLTLSGLTALQELACDYNQLTTLDASGLTALEKLTCNNNQLGTLNLSGITALKELYCNDNQLAALTVSGLTDLEILYCQNNLLTELTVSGLNALEDLSCSGNKLTSLDLTGLPLRISFTLAMTPTR